MVLCGSNAYNNEKSLDSYATWTIYVQKPQLMFLFSFEFLVENYWDLLQGESLTSRI